MSHEVILRGTMAVDARRAAAKIRDHLLADPSTWLCELARVAAASGASVLAVELSATSIAVEWNGQPMSTEVIEYFGRHLLNDEIEDVSPRERARGRAKKRDRRAELLTLAAFGAFGDGAKAVELSIASTDAGRRETKTRRLLREESEGVFEQKSGYPLQTRATAEVFSLLSDASGRVDIGLPLAWSAALRALGLGKEPRAVDALRRRMGSGLAVRLDGQVLEVAGREVVLSVELPALDGLAVRLDLLSQSYVEARVSYYELGFEIARSSLFEPAFHDAPIRVVVSGDEIATNASRSVVDEALTGRVKELVLTALPSLFESLRSAMVKALEQGDTALTGRLEEASGHLAGTLLRGRKECSHLPFYKAFSGVLGWPLLRDAVGRPLAVEGAIERADGGPLYGLAADRPLDAEYATLTADVVWRRGVSAELSLDLLEFDPIRSDVEEGLRRLRERVASPMAFAPHPREQHWWRHEVVDKDGFQASIALDIDTSVPCEVRAFVSDHWVETLEAEHVSPLFRFDAAVRWGGVLKAERTMRAIARGVGSGRMLARLGSAVIEVMLARLRQPDVATPGRARDLALRMLAANVEPRLALRELRLWQTADGCLASTDQVLRYVQNPGHLFVLAPYTVSARARAPKEVVVVVADAEWSLLGRIAPGAALIDYQPYLDLPPATVDSVKRHLAQYCQDSCAYEHAGRVIAVAPALTGRHIVLHRGRHLGEVELTVERGMVVVTDGESILRRSTDECKEVMEDAWQRMIQWLASDPARMSAAVAFNGIRDALVANLLHTLQAELLKSTRSTLSRWPVFILSDAEGERIASAVELAAHFEGSHTIPAIRPGQPPHAGSVVIAGREERTAIGKLTGKPCKQARTSDVVARAVTSFSSVPESTDLSAAVRDLVPLPAAAAAAAVAVETPAAAVAVELELGLELEPPPRRRVVAAEPLEPVRGFVDEPAQKHAAEKAKRAEIVFEAPPPPVWGHVAPPAARPVTPPVRRAATAPTGAWDKLVGLFQKPLEDAPDDHPLQTLTRRITQNLYVADLELRFAAQDAEPVRFDAKTTTLVLNPEHPTVRTLIANGDVIPLVAAAFSEINRELAIVSDSEERHALGRLLLDPPESK